MISRTKAIPNQIENWPALRRATRLGQAAVLFGAVLLGASCVDGSRLSGPLSPFGLSGKLEYDSLPPLDRRYAAYNRVMSGGTASKFAPQPLSSLSSSAEPGFALTTIPFAPEKGPFKNYFKGCEGACLFNYEEDGAPVFDASGTPLGFPIGFSFTFFGNTYDRFYWSSEGFLTFTHQYNGCCEGYVIPANDLPEELRVNNVIAVAWADLEPKVGEVGYETRGTPGNRRLIINMTDVEGFIDPSWGLPSDFKVTAQLVLHEGSNAIEIHTTSLAQSRFMKATQGIENADGSEALFVDGRVSDFFSLDHDAIRFASPAGANRAPSVDAGGNAGGPPADHYVGREGSPIDFKATGSDADGGTLTFTWDFNGDGVADANAAEATYAYPDNGEFTARVTVKDPEGLSATAEIDVIVENVKPTAVLQGPDAVDEGSPIVISVSDVVDPSAADQAAGFRYAFDCGGGYGEFSTASSASCATVDNSTLTVGVRVRDQNDGENPYTKSVTVRNVAPVVDAGPAISVMSGQVASLAGRFSDAGSNDKMWNWSWNTGDQGLAIGSQYRSAGSTAEQGPVVGQYRACSVGPQVLTLAVTDKDGGRGEANMTVNVQPLAVEMKVRPSGIALRVNDRDSDSDDNDDDRYSHDHGRLVTVHVYSTATFDATSIDPGSVRLTNGAGKGTPVASKRKRKGQEWEMKVGHLNRDRLRDVKLRFNRNALIANGDLTGSTVSFNLVARAGTCAYVGATAPVVVKP